MVKEDHVFMWKFKKRKRSTAALSVTYSVSMNPACVGKTTYVFNLAVVMLMKYDIFDSLG